MKRSEMEIYLEQQLIELRGYKEDNAEIVDVLLYAVEKAGMLPPINPIWEDKDTYDLQKKYGLDIYTGFGDPDCKKVAEYSHTWEMENDSSTTRNE